MSTRLTARCAVLVLLGIWIIFAACGDDNGTGPSGGLTPITFPLTIGNTWVHEAVSETLKVAQARMDTSRVVGTEEVEGETFYVLEERSEGETTQILIRQDGQDILVIPPFDDTGNGNPVQRWFRRVIDESLPWKFADLDAASGSSWIIAEAETTIQFGAKADTFRVLATGSSLGRTTISVPAGSFDGVYVGDIEMTVTMGAETSTPTSQTFWVADDVGLVKDVSTEIVEGEFEDVTVTTTSELVSYTVE